MTTVTSPVEARDAFEQARSPRAAGAPRRSARRSAGRPRLHRRTAAASPRARRPAANRSAAKRSPNASTRSRVSPVRASASASGAALSRHSASSAAIGAPPRPTSAANDSWRSSTRASSECRLEGATQNSTSVLVTPVNALTTTTGGSASDFARASTSAHACAKLDAMPTDVPPNFITTRCMKDLRGRARVRVRIVASRRRPRGAKPLKASRVRA